jgi:hypothetical protein
MEKVCTTCIFKLDENYEQSDMEESCMQYPENCMQYPKNADAIRIKVGLLACL